MAIQFSEMGCKSSPSSKEDIELVFPFPLDGDRQESVRTVDMGHGRIETRRLTTSEALVGYNDWPSMAQVFELGRHVITKQTGKERVEVVDGITSLSPEKATPSRLLELVRGHWHIENTSHCMRDVTFDEDRSQVRSRNIPQPMAALRNTAIGLLLWSGHTNIAAACRRMAALPAQALALVGIEREKLNSPGRLELRDTAKRIERHREYRFAIVILRQALIYIEIDIDIK